MGNFIKAISDAGIGIQETGITAIELMSLYNWYRLSNASPPPPKDIPVLCELHAKLTEIVEGEKDEN